MYLSVYPALMQVSISIILILIVFETKIIRRQLQGKLIYSLHANPFREIDTDKG